ncbi:hypothetical protein L1987_51205 [Smallanthus sonchifolius]|uniref:Uncharacterized protein n=1 Tax=Smallanthus sonchifolius TaxID=185202 RepID=A0ACB9EQ28_9ASTR|nr:hypothetical protein L1987_51205 [Smallanthus sonchifolius]
MRKSVPNVRRVLAQELGQRTPYHCNQHGYLLVFPFPLIISPTRKIERPMCSGAHVSIPRNENPSSLSAIVLTSLTVAHYSL